ncbi:ester hydrolase C11orf54-like [Anoplolepis gracilipes]|uniref:ester hydrolase C11orf54-like n=1 Tax=Anoplolepis gracilipes TaxID=354296 RepID=UPI003BA122ED
MPVRQMSLLNPEKDVLANILEDGLKQHFETAEVKWDKYPDLWSREPFNLVAPGSGGETAFIDIGDLSYLISHPRMNKKYDIPKILQLFNRDYSNLFIFGNGVLQTSTGELYEKSIK